MDLINTNFQGQKERLYSLDALRGFDMFWIIGAEEVVHEWHKATGSPFSEAISRQLTHPAWNGFHFYDLIFPLFIFISGVAIPYSVGREIEKGKTKKQMAFRVIKRGITLVILGILYNNGLELKAIGDMRFGSVLGRIGLAYMFSALIYLFAKKRALLFWFAGILVGYWLLLKFTSAPGFPTGDLTMKGNFASYIDRHFLPGAMIYRGIHDPEGLLSTIPAIANGLLGIFTGSYLKNSLAKGGQKASRLAIAGIILFGIAQIWNLDFPINKNLWTSSFVLQTGGFSLLLLALFYFIIDVLGYKKWAFFFTVIGMNSILIYMSGQFINWEYATNGFFKWAGQLSAPHFTGLVLALCQVALQWLFLYGLYRKKVFLRV